MPTGNILTNVAIILLAAALYSDLRQGNRITPVVKTYLTVACVFAAISAILQAFF